MKKRNLSNVIVFVIILALSVLMGTGVQAASKDLVAGKRTAYKDDSTESMRDVFKRREQEEKEYRQMMLSNSEESVKLLKEIKDLLQQLNEKE